MTLHILPEVWRRYSNLHDFGSQEFLKFSQAQATDGVTTPVNPSRRFYPSSHLAMQQTPGLVKKQGVNCFQKKTQVALYMWL